MFAQSDRFKYNHITDKIDLTYITCVYIYTLLIIYILL